VPAFDYARPGTLDEAVALLATSDGRSRPLAGGTDLLVQLRAERYELDLVVDVKAVAELNELRLDPTAGLTFGAAVPCFRIYEDPRIQAAYPGLIDAVSIIGGIGIQGRATVGGNLCNAAPSAESIPALIVLGATCLIAGPSGRRTVPVEAFCTGPGATVLASGELLVSVHVPPPTPRTGSYYLRFTPRNEMDIAVVGAGAWIALAEDGRTIADARLALGAVAPTPLVVDAAPALLVGTHGNDEALESAGQAARDAARPITDMRGSAAQRRHLAGILAVRALRGALARARGESVEMHPEAGR
jgi:carbon-monoxide dehydrogenase medium subunit